MLYFIGIKLPKDLEEKVYELKDLAGVGKLTTAPPHITLIPSFKIKDESLFQEIGKKLENLGSFEAEIKGIGYFKNRGKKNVVHLDVYDSEELIEIRSLIFDLLKGEMGEEIFKKNSDFHITISKKLSPHELMIALEKLKDVEIKYSFSVNEVALFKIKDNKPWQEYKVFNLK